MMRKWMICLTALLLCCAATGAMAAGTTLHVLTPFADVDFAAQGYMDAISAWEALSGNLVEDYSGTQDATWRTQLTSMVASGKADVVIVPPGTGLNAAQLVSVQELLTASPDCGARSFASMAETGGVVLLTPVRLNWEALYVNTDVLTANGLAVPTSAEALLTTCTALAQKGILPIANALGDWPEFALDCAALMGADAAAYGQQASLTGAQRVLTALVQAGAFGKDAFTATDAAMETAFLNGQAAMRFDSDGLALRIPAARHNSVQVVSFTGTAGQAGAIVGTPSYGLAITRACWADTTRREAALSLAAYLLGEQGMAALCTNATGQLGQSIVALHRNATDCVGTLYAHNANHLAWQQSLVNTLKGL